MRLQINVSAVQVCAGSKLGIIGTNEGREMTTVVFALVLSTVSELAWLSRSDLVRGSVLYDIVVEQRVAKITDPGDYNSYILIFNRTLVGKLRDARKYLRATARTLMNELTAIKDTPEIQEPVAPINMLSTDNWRSDRRQIAEEQGPDGDDKW